MKTLIFVAALAAASPALAQSKPTPAFDRYMPPADPVDKAVQDLIATLPDADHDSAHWQIMTPPAILPETTYREPTYPSPVAPVTPSYSYATGYRDGRTDGFYGDGYAPRQVGGSYESGYRSGMEHSFLLDDDNK